jgi:hypothetical protein
MIHISALLLPHQVMVFHWTSVVVEDGQGVVGLDQEVIVHPPVRGHDGGRKQRALIRCLRILILDTRKRLIPSIRYGRGNQRS